VLLQTLQRNLLLPQDPEETNQEETRKNNLRTRIQTNLLLILGRIWLTVSIVNAGAVTSLRTANSFLLAIRKIAILLKNLLRNLAKWALSLSRMIPRLHLGLGIPR
jgi:hypothetical protein